jgi:hypothetical protein
MRSRIPVREHCSATLFCFCRVEFITYNYSVSSAYDVQLSSCFWGLRDRFRDHYQCANFHASRRIQSVEGVAAALNWSIQCIGIITSNNSYTLKAKRCHNEGFQIVFL